MPAGGVIEHIFGHSDKLLLVFGQEGMEAVNLAEQGGKPVVVHGVDVAFDGEEVLFGAINGAKYGGAEKGNLGFVTDGGPFSPQIHFGLADKEKFAFQAETRLADFFDGGKPVGKDCFNVL